MRQAWYLSQFTGLFRAAGPTQRRAHDPAVAVWAGTPANRPVSGQVDGVGGAGFTDEAAELAAVGEAIERWQTHQLPVDAMLRARLPDSADESTGAGPRAPTHDPASLLDPTGESPRPAGNAVGSPPRDPASFIDPAAWVLFHPEQYAQPGFPFVPVPRDEVLDWVKFRRVADGEPVWVPTELAFMDLRPGAVHRFTPAISTGWSAHRSVDRAVLRGVQEVIERDALIGGWWGAYPIEPHPIEVPPALARPNLTYRAYRIASPFSDHVTMVTVEGDDHEGPCFAIGSACRETRAASLDKATLEAVQGRHYVRYLRSQFAERGVTALPVPRDFREHAVAYSLEPARLATTPLATARPPSAPTAGDQPPAIARPASAPAAGDQPPAIARPASAPAAGDQPLAIARTASTPAADHQPLAELVRRLGDAHPPLFRLMTPPALTQHGLDWVVVRVMIPGLQPMHGDHALPFLGGPHWRGRSLAAWADIPPHPFA